VLEARSVRAELRPDGDLDLTIDYPRPGVGPLRLTAAHLQRNADEMSDATLKIFVGDKLLGRRVLGADRFC
jgi:hypothetical protein